jgi:murein DD-endopeptidase MepM/ murein hydrolase activator NlpD
MHYPSIHPTSLDNSKFSSGFGYRYDPFTKNRKIHEGHDFSAKVGTEVCATANGVVKSSRFFGSFGNYIEIDHGNGYTTTYGHLSKRLVRKGQSIQRGDIIGKVGNTGRSTAPHLHYEIKYNNKKIDPSSFYFDLSL